VPVSLSSHSISDYLDMRGYKHSRLDGSTNRVMREVRINLFNKPQSPQFIFCLSTRYVCVMRV
jgi:SNF2 family DNA or RNA helicase